MIGHPHVHVRRIDSTNSRARELAGAGAPHGTLVTAAEQTHGRGRQGRSWWAPPGTAALMSVVVRGHRGAPLPLVAGLAACEALEAGAPVRCALKWPNDIWIDARKAGGVLVEARPGEEWAVVGIGLNIGVTEAELPAELRGSATSLAIAAPGSALPAADGVVDAVLGALARRLEQASADVLAAWAERDALRGRPVRWQDGEGLAAGIDAHGHLLVDASEGRMALDAGEVHLLASADQAGRLRPRPTCRSR